MSTNPVMDSTPKQSFSSQRKGTFNRVHVFQSDHKKYHVADNNESAVQDNCDDIILQEHLSSKYHSAMQHHVDMDTLD